MTKSKSPAQIPYVALLRGVNVGGNRMISMSALKQSFEQAGFTHVRSYINSGNMCFLSPEKDQEKLEEHIEQILRKKHALQSKVIIRSLNQMKKVVKKLPSEWHTDKTWKHNVIFLGTSIDTKKILKELPIKKEIERIVYFPGTLLWSAKTAELTRSQMVKLSRNPLYQSMTARNPNTVKHLYELMNRVSV